jgi:hypothetical protein
MSTLEQLIISSTCSCSRFSRAIRSSPRLPQRLHTPLMAFTNAISGIFLGRFPRDRRRGTETRSARRSAGRPAGSLAAAETNVVGGYV